VIARLRARKICTRRRVSVRIRIKADYVKFFKVFDKSKTPPPAAAKSSRHEYSLLTLDLARANTWFSCGPRPITSPQDVDRCSSRPHLLGGDLTVADQPQELRRSIETLTSSKAQRRAVRGVTPRMCAA
jgi:hypothetical protein